MPGPYADTELARSLRDARAERRVTQQQVAEALGVPFTYVSRWERAEVRPGLDNLAELAAFYEIDLVELVRMRRDAPASGRARKRDLTPEQEAARAAAAIAEQGPRARRPRSSRGSGR